MPKGDRQGTERQTDDFSVAKRSHTNRSSVRQYVTVFETQFRMELNVLNIILLITWHVSDTGDTHGSFYSESFHVCQRLPYADVSLTFIQCGRVSSRCDECGCLDPKQATVSAADQTHTD